MPSNENGQNVENGQPPDIERCAIALETLSPSFDVFVLHNWRFGQAGLNEAMAMARVLIEEGQRVAVLVFDAEYFKKLAIGIAPDHEHDFRAGRPIAVSPGYREARPKHPRNRPDDTVLVEASKTALEVTAFGLAAAQTTVELARNTRRVTLTPAAAGEKALETLSTAISPKEGAVAEVGSLNRLKGLIDRGRRIFQRLFPMQRARDVALVYKSEAEAKLASGATLETIEAGNLELLQALDGQEERTRKREGAMYRWNRNVDEDQPVDAADLRELTNAFIDRESAVELMRVAIAGDINPADTHGNLKTMRRTFAAGRKIGVLLRGQPITVTVEDALEIEAAIATVRSQRLETQKDGCYYYLADALGRCEDPLAWPELAGRIVASGRSEIVLPQGDPT